MKLLQSKDWLNLARLWSEIVDHHLGQPEDALAHLRRMLRRHYSIYQLHAVICTRDRPAQDDPLFGWTPGIVYFDDITPAPYLKLGQEWASELSNILEDPWCINHMRSAGEHRVSWRPHLLGETPWHKTRGGELMALTEVRDRLNATFAISPTLEVTFTLDAHLNQRDFVERDVHFAQALLLGLKPLALRMALSHGLLEGHDRLSPRERETLLLLLKGGSEKEIAEALGLSPKTIHQYVVSLYRKFNVRSRPELMALWLEPPPLP